MKISTSGYKLVFMAIIYWLGFGFQNSYGQSITSTSGSWFSSSTWTNGNAPGTSVTTSTRVVNPIFLDGSGGSLNLMSSGNINSIINAPITDNSSSGWSITFSNNGNNYLELNSTFYIKNNFDIAGGFPTTFAGNGYIGGTLSMQNNGGISLRIKSGYTVTVGGLNNYGGLIYIEPGASLIIIGNATISNNGSAGIVADGSLVVKGSLSVQGGSGISGTGTLTTPNPITLQNNGGATVFGQTYASTGGSIACSSGSPCNLSTNTVCSGVTVAIGTSQSICSGATPTQLSTVSGTAITGAVTYQWVQYSASTNSYQNVSSGGTGATYAPGALTQQTFYKLKVTKATCTTYSSAVTVTVSSTPTISNANITGTTSFCAGTNGLVYTVNGIAGASSYSWTFPSGFTVVTTNGNFATVNTSGSAVSGQISVSGVNSCGTSSAVAVSVTVNAVPAAPGLISGSNSFCFLGSTNVYSIQTISGATSYSWIQPSGCSIASPNNINTVTITAPFLNGTGTISVSGVNACGAGPAATLATTIALPTFASGTLIGNTTICQGSMAVYTISGGFLATNYNWTVPVGFSMISQNGTSSTLMTISISGTTTGTLSVTGSSGCGSAAPVALGVTVYPTIAGTGAIIGSSSLCQSSSSTYTLSGLSNVSAFNWSLPSGFTISSGQGTSVIGVNISSIAGTGSLSISGSNTCGTSNTVIQSITINSTPTGVGAFSGSNPVCLGTSYNYTVTGLTNASSYNWTVPSGFTISSGQGTSVLGFTVASSASGGNMSISGSNVCGSGLKSMLVITTATTPSGTGAITGSSPVCQSTSANYTVTGISNLSFFNWSVPSGVTINSGQGTSVIGVTFSSAATTGSISISGSNTCGNGNTSTLSVTVNATPSGTGAITGSSTVCQNTSANYTVTGISNLSSFNWSVPSGVTLNSGQGTSVIGVTFTSAAVTSSISIAGSNTCGNGNQSTLSVTINATPGGTGAFSGSTSVCPNTLVNYTVTGISKASTLTWSTPSGYTISSGQGTSVIGVTFSLSAASGVISVLGSNTCGNGNLNVLAITVNSTPTGNGAITGSIPVCQGTSANYTVTGISNLSSFNWSVPSGFTISSGQGTSVIGVTFSSAATTGSISISGSNTCGNGNQSTLPVTINTTPSGTGAITGTTSLCQGVSATYTLTGISNASSFNWSVPSGFTINSGQGTSILGVTFAANASSGILSISGSNICGSGLLATQVISVVTAPSNPLTISGSLNVCQGQSSVIYNTTVTNASSFNWALPSGASITAGSGTSSITVTYSSSATSGILTVQGINGICQGNTSSAYNVTVNSSISSNTLTGFANIICWNTLPLTTLSGTTVTGGTGNYTYLWESSTVSGTAGFISATGINTNTSYIPGVLGTTTWYKRIVNSGSCPANTSTGVSINVISLTGSWIGMNSDWNSSSNWCLGTIPGSVFIDAGRPNYPVITVGGISISDLTIASGASLTLNSPSYVTISGNFLNSGTFTASTGTGIVFNGVSVQSISGTNTFYDLTLAKSSVSAPVVLAGNTSIKGSLTLSDNAKLVTTGYSFVLLSSINETARIASIPATSTIVGNITMQRYVPAKLSFRFLSSAVTGSTMNDWKGNMFITGNGAGSDVGSSVPVVSQYNETLAGNQNVGFQSITSGTTTPLQPGKGYRVFVRGDRSIVLTSNYAPTITTLSVSGVPNIGPISLPLTYTSTTGGNVSMDGWNLVGNPYASQIDWNLITAGGANFQHIDNAIYILDPISSSLTTAGQYLSYVNGVAAGPGATNPNPNVLSSSQAFFVHANAANPVLKIDENVKVANTVNNHFRVEEIPNLLRIAISGTNGEDNSVIRFTEGATENFDSAFDAYKLSNTGSSIASTPYTGLDLSINSMQPLDTVSRIVALNISTPVNGDHLLKFTSVPTFGPLVRIMLVDKYLNTTAEIEEGSTYAFTTTTVAGTKGNARFDVVFVPQLGSVKASIGPDSFTLVNSNPKWKLDTTWYNSSEIANYIPAGTHTISFATVPGWITPASQQVTVLTNALVTVSGVYLPIPKIGAVHVKLIPESLEKGRVRTQWRINDGPWKNSSISSIDSLPVGNYTISFNDLNGWVKPQEITVAIENGQETSITGEFIQIPDTSTASIEQLEETIETDTSKTKINKSADSTAVTGIAGKASNDLLEINAYPNPTGAEVPVISIKGLNNSNFKLTVFNQTGVSLYSKVFNQRDPQTAFQTRLEVFRELPDGLYLVQFMQEGHTLIKKVRK